MKDYIFTACVISILGLVLCASLKNAPARLRFYVVMISALAWCIPWQHISVINGISPLELPLTAELADFSLVTEFLPLLSTADAVREAKSTGNSWYSGNVLDVSLSMAFWLLNGVGLVWFIVKVYFYCRYLQGCYVGARRADYLWQHHALDGKNVSLLVSNDCDGPMATGIKHPIVWLPEKQCNSQQLTSILTHELTHIRQYDPAWMWLITFLHSVFWWNPLVRILTRFARSDIELSCDEKCRQALGHQYLTDLAQLMLNQHQNNSSSRQIMPVSHFRHFNINRIHSLSKETSMKAKYILFILTGLTLSGLAAATINGSSEVVQSEANQTESFKHYKKPSIYNNNPLHDEQVDELLAITSQAKTYEPEVLSDIYDRLVIWHANRSNTQNPRSESSLQVMAFTMMSYLLDKLNRPQEIVAHYESMLADTPMNRVLFLQHHRAIAYVKLGQAEKGIELLNKVIELQPQPAPGTLLLLAQAYLANDDGEGVLRIAEQIETLVGDSPMFSMQAINFKRAGFALLNDQQHALEMNNLLQQRFQREGWEPGIMGMASPLLAYLSEVNKPA